MTPLPIDALLPDLSNALRCSAALVVEAPPGAGKTTRIPWALLEGGWADTGEILVAEPRRLAARLAAHRVAEEHGHPLGQRVGYTVRFEDRTSAHTRIRYVTYGVLVRWLSDGPRLSDVAVVVLDEHHERSLDADVALALLRRLQLEQRPELRLLAMSATLQTDALTRYLGDCPCLRSTGRCFPVSIEHEPRPDDRPLEKRVVSAAKRVLREGPDGDLLVFLPGAREITRARDVLEPLRQTAELDVLPLHGDLPLEQQAQAVRPGTRRRIVLSTNVAESSITVDGVTAVIDSGLARTVTHSPWNGLPRMQTAKVSQASAAQRAGRAGRTRQGRVLRLYTLGDHNRRPSYDVPEIQRTDLSEALLVLHGVGVEDPAELGWLTPPPPAALASARELLTRLGALTAQGRMTELGRQMRSLPLHPRLARIVAEGTRRGVTKPAALAAALLAERDIRRRTRTQFEAHGGRAAEVCGPSDVLELMEKFEAARAARFDAEAVRAIGLDIRAVRSVARAEQQIARAARRLERSARDSFPPFSAPSDPEMAVRICLLEGFPDRVARRARPGSNHLVLSSGVAARLSEQSVVQTAPLMVALDVTEQTSGMRGAGTIVRLASAIEGEWLLDLHPDLLQATDELVWSSDHERVERVSRVACGSVTLEESRTPAPPSDAASRLLAAAARAAGPARFPEVAEELERLRARVLLLREHVAPLDWPELGENALARAFERATVGRVGFAQLSTADLAQGLRRSLTAEQAQALAHLAPERITLPSGRQLAVHYEHGKPPWVASRLQDFFGLTRTPRVVGEQLPLTLHLLAPNQRAVQVTNDLAGFWERHYPGIRRELSRRYPKHPWPEDGASAQPPVPRGRHQRRSVPRRD